MDIYREFQELFKSLNGHGVEYVIVGGYAMGHYGVPRTTQDMDILLHASPDHAPKIIAALEDFGFGGTGLTEADFQEPRFFFRLGRVPVQVDLLTTISGVSWDDAWANRSPGRYGDVPVQYIGRAEFIRNKLTAGRPEDIGDVSRIGGLPRKKDG